jgi:hypothetical protein
MKKKILAVVVVFFSLAVATLAQTCGEEGLITRSRCNNAGCGETFVNYGATSCTFSGNGCFYFTPITICCGTYSNYTEDGYCNLAKLQDNQVRLKLLELAQTTDLLIPNCKGAYVPAAFLLAATNASFVLKANGERELEKILESGHGTK